jgi:hypothetical protein
VSEHAADRPSSAGWVSRERLASAEEVSIVIDRKRITPWAALTGPKGDVRPEPATFGTRLRFLGRSATTVGVAVANGGQDGRHAFAVDRREVPT